MLYYGPAPCPDPFVPARHDNVFITARTLPPSLSCELAGHGIRAGKVLMTNNLPSAVEPGMLADPGLRDHSLPWFLSATTQMLAMAFFPQNLLSILSFHSGFYHFVETFQPLYIIHDV